MILVRNTILECFDGKDRKRDLDQVDYVVLHRIDFSEDDGAKRWEDVEPVPTDELTGPKMAAKFRDCRKTGDWRDRPGAWTGGQVPYTFLVRTDGSVDQCLALGDTGPHAGRWNSKSIGVAFAGDFRKYRPTDKQLITASELCALLTVAIQGADGKVEIKAHDELPGASRDANKKCPGKHFDVAHVRWRVDWLTEHAKQADAISELTRIGVVF